MILGGLLAIWAPNDDVPALKASNIGFLIKLAITIAISLAIMRWAGPAMVGFLGIETDYRSLRDTAPWKYIGFVAGGTSLVAGLMALVEGRPSGRGLLIGVLATLVLVILYDLPFDDLLLPPNGDV